MAFGASVEWCTTWGVEGAAVDDDDGAKDDVVEFVVAVSVDAEDDSVDREGKEGEYEIKFDDEYEDDERLEKLLYL